MATKIYGYTPKGEYTNFKIANDGKVYKNNGSVYIGVKISERGNIVNDSGRILQDDSNIRGYLEKNGFLRWF